MMDFLFDFGTSRVQWFYGVSFVFEVFVLKKRSYDGDGGLFFRWRIAQSDLTWHLRALAAMNNLGLIPTDPAGGNTV